MSLLKEIAETEAKLALLKRQAAAAPCIEVGHRWKLLGGANAGCRERGCGCSVPVSECEVCGDCDYGDTAATDEIRAAVIAGIISRTDWSAANASDIVGDCRVQQNAGLTANEAATEIILEVDSF